MQKAVITGAYSYTGSAVARELLLRDIVLTKEELLGLQQELLVSQHPPLGDASVEEWLMQNGEALGRAYVNDLGRHFGRDAATSVFAGGADDPPGIRPVPTATETGHRVPSEKLEE